MKDENFEEWFDRVKLERRVERYSISRTPLDRWVNGVAFRRQLRKYVDVVESVEGIGERSFLIKEGINHIVW